MPSGNSLLAASHQRCYNEAHSLGTCKSRSTLRQQLSAHKLSSCHKLNTQYQSVRPLTFIQNQSYSAPRYPSLRRQETSPKSPQIFTANSRVLPLARQASVGLSPTHSTVPKITFSYGLRSGRSQMLHQVTSVPNIRTNSALPSTTKQLRAAMKRPKNHLCSREYDHFYDPKGVERSLICLLEVSSISLPQEQEVPHCVPGSRCHSKMASTKASGSFHKDSRPSQLFSRGVVERGSWTDLSNGRMAESKVLDREELRRVEKPLITSENYTFGGLMGVERLQLSPSTPSPKHDSYSGERQWKHHLDRLIVGGKEEDMKYSIHCSPDIRSQPFSFELLDKFGRSIKQSVTTSPS